MGQPIDFKKRKVVVSCFHKKKIIRWLMHALSRVAREVAKKVAKISDKKVTIFAWHL